jgi:hypothetical protein
VPIQNTYAADSPAAIDSTISAEEEGAATDESQSSSSNLSPPKQWFSREVGMVIATMRGCRETLRTWL